MTVARLSSAYSHARITLRELPDVRCRGRAAAVTDDVHGCLALPRAFQNVDYGAYILAREVMYGALDLAQILLDDIHEHASLSLFAWQKRKHFTISSFASASFSMKRNATLVVTEPSLTRKAARDFAVEPRAERMWAALSYTRHSLRIVQFVQQ